MNEGQPSLCEQLERFYQGMQSRMAPADLDALRQAETQVAASGVDRALLRPGDAVLLEGPLGAGKGSCCCSSVAAGARSAPCRFAPGNRPCRGCTTRAAICWWYRRSASMSAAWWRSATCWPVPCCPTPAAPWRTATA